MIPRRQLPANARKPTTMSTNTVTEGISTPVFKPLNDQNRKDPKIINLSSRDLTTNEIKLLKKVLKFTPTLKTNKNELRNDIQEFGRKLRLIEYYDSHQNETDQSIVKNKLNFVPAKTNDKHLELFLDSLSRYPDQISAPQHVKSNLSKDE